jgi:hypothetical protein
MPKVRLTWDDPNATELGHRVYRSDAPMDPQDLPSPLAELGADVELYDDEAVALEETWFYRVSAFDGAGQEAVSDEIEVTVVEPEFSEVEVSSVKAGYIMQTKDTHISAVKVGYIVKEQ